MQGIFDETFILVLSPSAVFRVQNCLSDVFVICFDLEVKVFYQSSIGNEVDFTDIMNVTQNILAKN